jgi:hypothetical protein
MVLRLRMRKFRQHPRYTTNVNFQSEILPTDGSRLPIVRNGVFGGRRFWGSSQASDELDRAWTLHGFVPDVISHEQYIAGILAVRVGGPGLSQRQRVSTQR